jgi:hypothetical protein
VPAVPPPDVAETRVALEELSLFGEGSDVAEDTNAEFVIEEAVAGAVTTTVMAGAVAPEASDGRMHVTEALPEWEHDQPVPEADTNVTPGGRVSSTETLLARDGPWFVTESV